MKVLHTSSINIVWFNVPIWLVVSDARNKKSFPFQFTAVTFCTLYAAGVFCMALLVLATPITSGWVFVAHMVLLFFLATSLGVYTMANRSIEAMDAMDERAKSGAAHLNLHIRAVADRAQLCDGDGLEEMKASIAELVDAMHYATGESLPGSEAVEAEITGHFQNIENALLSIDDAADDNGLEEISRRVKKEANAAKLAISRREELMKTLR